MKIILLSGGSGQRLWPLSNGARSKQFLKVLSAPNGTKESMVQRVIRQIKETGLTESITIATSAIQKDIIAIQLGDDVRVVAEPERRDTFPAIALASAYLKLKQDCDENETVVIMPCDPFTETGYFETIAKMATAVEDGKADLVLMGITPTYASTKFGYIVPKEIDEDAEVKLVAGFTEKPDMARAEELISKGAVWNGGVFAFRLGYMINILNKYVKATSFGEVYSHYRDLPKISFDYEVVEKAQSVAMVPFKGLWKDLGTWNAVSQHLSDKANGNVVVDDSCENTHVINELSVPMICIGAKNMIVAATPDGILVCDKDKAETMKEHVKKVEQQPMYEHRRWGKYKVLEQVKHSDGYQSIIKQLVIDKEASLAYQVHHHRDEMWTIVDGEGLVVINGSVRAVRRGDVVHVQREMRHAIKATEQLTIIEVQNGDELTEADVERFPWEW